MPVGRVPGEEYTNRQWLTATVNIPSGNSISNVLRLHGRALLMMHTPSGIAGSLMSFQARDPAGTFQNLYDDAGSEVTVTYAASRAVGIDLTGALAAAEELYIRSGPAGSANNQTANMTVGFTLKG